MTTVVEAQRVDVRAVAREQKIEPGASPVLMPSEFLSFRLGGEE